MTLAELQKKIEKRTVKIAVVGLGYVGLPVAALLANKGFDVLGIEIKKERAAQINAGKSPIKGEEPGLNDLIESVVKKKTLWATSDYTKLSDREVVLVNVETPVNKEHVPEYAALRSAVKTLAENIQEGALVIIESTIMPGTMKNIVLPILEENSCRKCGDGFYLGNCPERVMPGKLLSNLHEMSRVVGGDSPETAAMMKAFYKHIVNADIDEVDWITAELVKTVENTYRDVQIAFANETALICEALGADVWRVRELVRKSPGREMLMPGAGVGGHCIPKDPWLLASSVKNLDVEIRLIPAAREINTSMPAHMLKLVKTQLGDLEDKKILLLGYAYLENSDDTRNSPGEALRELFVREGARVSVHDPYVKEFSGDLYQAASGCHTAVLVTAHSDYEDIDFEELKKKMKQPLLVDGRNLWNRNRAEEAGMEVIRLGDFA